VHVKVSSDKIISNDYFYQLYWIAVDGLLAKGEVKCSDGLSLHLNSV